MRSNDKGTLGKKNQRKVVSSGGLFKTTLWVKEKGATFYRLMNTIEATSTFKNTDDRNLDKPERQWEAAVDIMEGWRTNGNMHDARFKIVQTNLNAPFAEAPKTRHYGYGSDVDNENRKALSVGGL